MSASMERVVSRASLRIKPAMSGCPVGSIGLESDVFGRLVIVDIKTSKTAVSKDDTQQHAQLATYKLAVAESMLSADPSAWSPAVLA
ncbi:PD-(D/E)XK nuclease family protein [Mycobacterium lepromatosis]|uniref:PD-(D/E)XK nuclease family protein n=2 Tax=Mycobacterium lepromatosis TaxID=480418 RepID=UPI003D806D3F